jgi:hypothetical protein
VNKIVKVPDVASFCTAFGSLGLIVGPRTGVGKRSQDDKEWFVVRRFLKAGLRAGIFEVPISVQKRNPPEPDFALELNDGDAGFFEITEATDSADQKEMTAFEHSKKPAMLLGELGGRFSGGASQPGLAWASDVLNAILRKDGKAIFSRSDSHRHLIIYPNSNASDLLFDDEAELAAFRYLNDAIETNRCIYVQAARGCLVHVLGKEYVYFDLLGRTKQVRIEREWATK